MTDRRLDIWLLLASAEEVKIVRCRRKDASEAGKEVFPLPVHGWALVKCVNDNMYR